MRSRHINLAKSDLSVALSISLYWQLALLGVIYIYWASAPSLLLTDFMVHGKIRYSGCSDVSRILLASIQQGSISVHFVIRTLNSLILSVKQLIIIRARTSLTKPSNQLVCQPATQRPHFVLPFLAHNIGRRYHTTDPAEGVVCSR